MAYLDHAATTPMVSAAYDAWRHASHAYGNASSLHTSGRHARRAVEEAREQVAAALGARPSEVIFTAGGTESDNLAVKGIYWTRSRANPQQRIILASAVEHHAVLDTIEWLVAQQGAQVEWLDVDQFGRVHPETLASALVRHGDSVALVSVMWANNEVGTVQPIHELASIAAEHGVPFHTDAVQAVGHVPVHFGDVAASALTLTGHKLGGPYGVGALLLGRDVACTPVLHGGGQERGVRSGTLDVPGIAAFAAAVDWAVQQQPTMAPAQADLRDNLITRLCEVIPDAVLNGSPVESRLPNNAHFSFSGCEGDALLMLLDAQGVECSTGSACNAGVPQPSHVLLAMGVDPILARSSLRFSLGLTSTKADIDELIEAIGPAVERARNAGLGR